MSKLLQDVVGELSKLPGVGRRTALRLAIHILRMERDSVAEMTESIDRFRNEIRYCSQCNNLSDEEVRYIDDGIKPGDGLLVAGGARMPITNELPKGRIYDLLTTKPSEVNALGGGGRSAR